MQSRSLARPAACALVALLSTCAVCAAASSPPIPPVAEIPVAPTPAPKRVVLPQLPPATTTTITTTTTTTAPALAAVMVEPAAPPSGVVEAMPAAPVVPATSLHVVMVDELPFRATHTHARELPEHAEHGHHGKKHGRHGRPFHPAPGIVVDVPDASGASAADLQRTARNVGYWPFRHCYEEGLRRDQHMGGKVSLDLGLSPGGAVDAATVAGSSLRDESVVLCVAREAQHLTLAPAESAATAKLSVTLATGDEPVPVPRPVPHAEDLRDALRASWPAVQQCYAAELAKHPDAGGRLELKFHVRSGGAITEVAEGDSRFGDVDLTRCVLGVYRSAKLGSAGHGVHEGSFVYAIHLEARPERPVVAAALAPRASTP